MSYSDHEPSQAQIEMEYLRRDGCLPGEEITEFQMSIQSPVNGVPVVIYFEEGRLTFEGHSFPQWNITEAEAQAAADYFQPLTSLRGLTFKQARRVLIAYGVKPEDF